MMNSTLRRALGVATRGGTGRGVRGPGCDAVDRLVVVPQRARASWPIAGHVERVGRGTLLAPALRVDEEDEEQRHAGEVERRAALEVGASLRASRGRASARSTGGSSAFANVTRARTGNRLPDAGHHLGAHQHGPVVHVGHVAVERVELRAEREHAGGEHEHARRAGSARTLGGAPRPRAGRPRSEKLASTLSR